jgi:hypothetical protein
MVWTSRLRGMVLRQPSATGDRELGDRALTLTGDRLRMVLAIRRVRTWHTATLAEHCRSRARRNSCTRIEGGPLMHKAGDHLPHGVRLRSSAAEVPGPPHSGWVPRRPHPGSGRAVASAVAPRLSTFSADATA